MNRMILVLLAFLCVYGTGRLQDAAKNIEKENWKEPSKKRSEENRIRVVLKTSDFASIYHQKPQIVQEASGGCRVESLQRSCGTPEYRGEIEVIRQAEGCVLINELPLEEYLYGVVGSEMPSGYEREALKAQAVAARTYACLRQQKPEYPQYQAALDDSTSCQVYGNIEECEVIREVVDDTQGEILQQGGRLQDVMYYSTSAGQKRGVSLMEERQLRRFLLSENPQALESSYPYFRWHACCEKKQLEEAGEILGEKMGRIQSVRILERREDGTAVRMSIQGTKKELTVETEYQIRQALAQIFTQITRQDGSTLDTGRLLPSACVYLEADEEGNLNLIGGGYGHGCGMSQNLANEMAKRGDNYREILRYFYPDMEIGGNE